MTDEVAVTIELNKAGDVVSVRNAKGQCAEPLTAEDAEAKVKLRYIESLAVVMTEQNPCYTVVCIGRKCWKVEVPC